MNIYQIIEELIEYAVIHLNLADENIIYTRNQLYYLLNIREPKSELINKDKIKNMEEPSHILSKLNTYLKNVANIKETDFQKMNAQIMDLLMPKPKEVIDNFYKLKDKERTNYLYDLAIKSYYIRKNEIDKNIIWEYPNLIITINLSKPEILKNKKPIPISNYPKCPLCIENVGFHGDETKESRQNLRVIPISLNNEQWYLQYSPYVYYQEHCIVFNKLHKPMQITIDTFKRLLDFVDLFPYYFIGSNAGLPHIGGSILSHDHYQGGNYHFPLQRASIKKSYYCKEFPNVNIGIVDWYNSVIRLSSKNKRDIITLANRIYQRWLNYDCLKLDIISKTKEQHNGITPIVHKENDNYVINIILRNNRTSKEYPDGIFHAHPQYHHIKKEAIGLIEAMGMFILPGRLEKEVWKNREFKNEIYHACINILENIAVFKNNKDSQLEFDKFMKSIFY